MSVDEEDIQNPITRYRVLYIGDDDNFCLLGTWYDFVSAIRNCKKLLNLGEKAWVEMYVSGYWKETDEFGNERTHAQRTAPQIIYPTCDG